MREILLVRFGEVHLKGLNRPQFLKQLLDNVRRAVKPFNAKAWMSESRIYVSGADNRKACADAVARVFGVHSVSLAVEMDKADPEAVFAQAAELAKNLTGTFKVRARRSDKRYPLDSPAICVEAGGHILDANPNLTVDVVNPTHVIDIEIRDCATLHIGRIEGAGGLPMGKSGKACLLLSGGIDSPVAGYMIARRGVTLICVHFHSFPYTSERAREKVVELARILSETCGHVALFIVPFTDLQLRIHELCPDVYGTLIMRRQMMRIAEKIARREGASALITGESIGQVASQTIEALGCTDDVCGMPVFRPLIGVDKADIIEKAEKLGTFETSTLPYEDCCTVFTPRHPATHPKIDRVREAEALLGEPLEGMIEACVTGAERVVLFDGRIVEEAKNTTQE